VETDKQMAEFRKTPGGGLEVKQHGVWTHVPPAAAAEIARLTVELARAGPSGAADETAMPPIAHAAHNAAEPGAQHDVADDPLAAYSQGRLARSDAIRLLGLRDYAALLVALGDADLPMPLPSPDEVDDQAATFVNLWKQS
jgi:hypothetical protein